MKKIIAIVALSLSLSALATPVSKAELKKVNDGIAAILAAQDDGDETIAFSVVSADRNAEGRLSAANVAFTLQGGISMTASISAEAGAIKVAASAKASLANFGLDYAQVLSMAPMLQQTADAINQEGTYHAALAMSSNASSTSATMTLVPAKPDPTNSVKSLKIAATVYKDTTKPAVISASATMNTSSDNVVKAQTALSNMFNSLAAGQEPAESDEQALEEVISLILGNIAG